MSVRPTLITTEFMTETRYVLDDPDATAFKVNRAALVDPWVLELEQRSIFDVCWIYVGHESEVRAAGDFKTRTICGRPLIFCRDSSGGIRVLLNSCRHRGTVVCREPEGNAERYRCFYHGWTYDLDGQLQGVPGEDSYGDNFDRSKLGLQDAPGVESYRGFVFVNFSAEAEPLLDYLAGATEYIDLVVDQSPSGEMEIIQGTQAYDIQANWKLLVENSFDDYHLLSTHVTWLQYLKDSGVEMQAPPAGHLLPAHGVGKPLGNGHAVIDNINFRGRPIARWIPIYGEAAKPEIEAISGPSSSPASARNGRRALPTPTAISCSSPIWSSMTARP